MSLFTVNRNFFAPLFAIAILCLSQNGFADVSKTYDLDPFSAIKLRVPGDVKVKVGEEQRVKITADEDVFKTLKLKLKNGILTITEEKNRRWGDDIEIEISVRELNSVRISGAGSFEIDNIQADTFTAQISGSGDIKANGKVRKLALNISGSGDIKMENLEAEHVDVKISGAGDAKVYAKTLLKTRISGSGDIAYRGNPKLETKISGSGNVKSL